MRSFHITEPNYIFINFKSTYEVRIYCTHCDWISWRQQNSETRKKRTFLEDYEHSLFFFFSLSLFLKFYFLTLQYGTGKEEGGGFRMGNMCIPVVDSCWYMAKPIQYWTVTLNSDFPLRDFEIPVVTPETMEQFYLNYRWIGWKLADLTNWS